MAKRKWTSEEVRDIVESYESGATFKELQAKYNAHYYTLKQVLSRNDIDTSGKRKWSIEDTEDIVDLYVNKGLTIQEIRNLYNARTQTIMDILKDNGVNTTENMRVSVNRLMYHDFFERIDTEEKAYFLGMLMADGCVRHPEGWTPTIALELIDLDVIEKFQTATNSDGKITRSDRKRRVGDNPTYTATIRSEKMAEDLAKYGVVWNKTYDTQRLQCEIPESLRRHLLRGMFDGDGSIYISKEERWFVSLTNKHVTFLEDVQDWLQELIPELKRVKTYDGKSVARITYSGRTAKKVCEALYTDAKVSMQRKQDLADRLVEDIV